MHPVFTPHLKEWRRRRMREGRGERPVMLSNDPLVNASWDRACAPWSASSQCANTISHASLRNQVQHTGQKAPAIVGFDH